MEGHTDRGSHRGARQIHNRLTRFSSHLISYFYHRAPLRCGATRACHQRPAQGGLALAPADKDQRRGPPQRPQQPFLFPPYSLFLSSSSATLRRHSRIPSATRARRACPRTRRQGPTARTAAATTAAVSFPTLFLIFIIELSYAAAPLAHTISDPLISDLVRETVPARLPRRTPVRGGARSTEA